MWKTTAKWVGGGIGLLVVVAHIGVLGHLKPQQREFPQVNLPPVNEYSTFRVRATRDGYEIEYIGNDPKVLTDETRTQRENGTFGIGGNSQTHTTRQFTQDSRRNQEGGGDQEGKLTAEQIACIEAAGGGRAQGAIVGGSVASGVVVPAVINIPYVGWLAAGWATLLGTEWGGNLGAEVNTIIQGCL